MVIGAVAEVIGNYYYSHSKLNSLFMEAGAPGDVPFGNSVEKCRAWLKRTNAEKSKEALDILGRVIERFMESPNAPAQDKKRILKALARSGLSYQPGGLIFGTADAIPASSLATIIHERNLPALRADFERALANVNNDPSAALTEPLQYSSPCLEFT